MAGIYKGAQSRVMRMNEFVPWQDHSLRLVGVHSLLSCAKAVILLGFVQKLKQT